MMTTTRIVAESVSAVTKGKVLWATVKKYPKMVGTTTTVITVIAGAMSFLYYIGEDYKKILLPLREIENNLNPLDKIIEKIKQTTTPSLSSLEYVVNFFEPTKLRASLVTFSLAEVYRSFNQNDAAMKEYEECKANLRTGSQYPMLINIYSALRFDERTASDVMLMPWKCDAQILQLKLVAITGAQFQQIVLTDRMKEAEGIISSVCEANYVCTITKKNFLAPFICMLGQRRSMVSHAEDPNTAMKSSLVLFNTANALLVTNDSLSGKWYQTQKSYYENENMTLLVSEAHAYAKNLAGNVEACLNNDVRANILYNWMVISRNCKDIDESFKSKARDYAWDCGFYKGVRPNIKRNIYFMAIDGISLTKLLSEITATGYKEYANIVLDTSQHTDLSMPFAIALAMDGRYQEALAMYLYLDHTRSIKDHEILPSCKSLNHGGANNYSGHYSFLAFLLYALDKKEIVYDLLQYVKVEGKLTADHKLFLKALQPSMITTLLKDLKTEMGTDLSKWKTKTDLWWLACCLRLVPDSHKVNYVKELNYFEELRKRLQ